MTDQELEELRDQYRAEYAKVEAWLNEGLPYDGTWVPEIAGKQPGQDAKEGLRSVLLPGLLFLRFEERVVGQHPEYQNEIVDADGAVIGSRQAEVAVQVSEHVARLNALLGEG